MKNIFSLLSGKLLMSLLIIAVFSGCASTNRDERDRNDRNQKPVFTDMDLNNDGYINKDEFKGPENLFEETDKNGDSLITEEEFRNMPKPPSKRPPKRS